MGCGASMDGFPSKQSRKKEDLIETKHEKVRHRKCNPQLLNGLGL
jgi:hypothetical protein